MSTTLDDSALGKAAPRTGPVFAILGGVSFAHMLNDMIQSLLLAVYPMLKSSFDLSFGQIGLITLTYQITASLLQPVIGLYTDKRPKPYSLPVGMGFTLAGLLLLSVAPNYPMLLIAAAFVGTGSSVFHPESSRVARMASGGQHGFAQSLFQVGGNLGSALGPLLAALIVIPRGQYAISWFSLAALLAMGVLIAVGRWYKANAALLKPKAKRGAGQVELSRGTVTMALVVLGVLVFSKFFYLASLSSYYTFYLISKFGLSVQSAQVHLFVLLASVAAGTIVGGPVGDRIGRKIVIWVSILGVAPFTLLLPYADLFWTSVLSVIIGLVLSSAFSAIVVFGQELVPGNVGLIAGLFFGLSFGMGGIGAAVLGRVADVEGIDFVYRVCSFLPLIGVLTVFLPNLERPKRA